MLDIKYIREKRDEVIQRLLIRGRDYTFEIDKILELDERKRNAKKKLDDIRRQRNILSKVYKK